jgi:hypothetical protein
VRRAPRHGPEMGQTSRLTVAEDVRRDPDEVVQLSRIYRGPISKQA